MNSPRHETDLEPGMQSANQPVPKSPARQSVKAPQRVPAEPLFSSPWLALIAILREEFLPPRRKR